LIGLSGGHLVYQGRNFYSIDYSYAEKVLLDLIIRPSGEPCTTEKGTKEEIAAQRRTPDPSFAKKSLFRAVADRRIALPFEDPLLICDDLGTECADFLAANISSRQMALIHAKAGEVKGISASAFHDVVSQAMKNLVYLTRNAEAPEKVGSWTRKEKWNGTGVPRIVRTPDGVPEKAKLWNKLKAEIIDSSDPGLFVVLVTTGCCDVEKLREVTGDPTKRTPETAQLFHLLDGLNGYARQLGAKVLIRDMPYQK
jgi:hypothetical protein